MLGLICTLAKNGQKWPFLAFFHPDFDFKHFKSV